MKNNQRRQSWGRVGSHVPEATFRTAHLYARNLSLRLLYCDLMIKPNKTKTWPSGAAFNISESAAGIQLFSVWIHFPFINISVCINKIKVALRNQRKWHSSRRADWWGLEVCGQSSPTQGSDVGPDLPIDGQRQEGSLGREMKLQIMKGGWAGGCSKQEESAHKTRQCSLPSGIKGGMGDFSSAPSFSPELFLELKTQFGIPTSFDFPAQGGRCQASHK